MVQVDRELHIHTLLSLGSGKPEKEIRDLLEHHNWNPDAAAGALFDIHVQSSASTRREPALAGARMHPSLNGNRGADGTTPVLV
jgi:hypothetical protein